LNATARLLEVSLQFLDDHLKQAARERIRYLSFQIAIACEPNLFLSDVAMNGHVGPSRRMTRGTAEGSLRIFRQFDMVSIS
jgi:hypothetical protein